MRHFLVQLDLDDEKELQDELKLLPTDVRVPRIVSLSLDEDDYLRLSRMRAMALSVHKWDDGFQMMHFDDTLPTFLNWGWAFRDDSGGVIVEVRDDPVTPGTLEASVAEVCTLFVQPDGVWWEVALVVEGAEKVPFVSTVLCTWAELGVT